MAVGRSNSSKVETGFSIYLRTGYRAPPGVALKFNPWHDSENGRFTFVGQGRYYPNDYVEQDRTQRDREAGAKFVRETYGGRRQPSERDPYVPDRGDLSPWHPKNWKVYVVRQGDSLTRIARMRKGLTVEYLAGLNRIPRGKLRLGQMLMLPTQQFLDDEREAYQKSVALLLYAETHGGQLPPDLANPPSVIEQANETRTRISKNGYQYELDLLLRTKRVTGILVDIRARGVRDWRNPWRAERIACLRITVGDFIARRFNGPREIFNHFAQDASFNIADYAALEGYWAAQIKAGRRVKVDIRASYEELSLRPSMITVRYWIDGDYKIKEFSNAPRRRKQ